MFHGSPTWFKSQGLILLVDLISFEASEVLILISKF